MRELSSSEIDSLLRLVEEQKPISNLIEAWFAGYSRAERRRRLLTRCGADMFVCLKNIFAIDKFDDIILREYADLNENYKEIYRIISAMESAGVRVHRQFLIRTLRIEADQIPAILGNMEDTISETVISERDGIYEWTGRHIVISQTLTKYEFSDQADISHLFHLIADNINPTYTIEMRTIRELCGRMYGIGRLRDKNDQNRVLRKLISIAPGERVPRHRLITNLIEMNDFAQAEAEMRVYEKDFRPDPVVLRYRIELTMKRAETAEDILPTHRVAIANEAAIIADRATSRFPLDKNLYDAYLEVGAYIAKHSGNWEVFDSALASAKTAEPKIADPDMHRMIKRHEVRAVRTRSDR
jgi:hypothetical protein